MENVSARRIGAAEITRRSLLGLVGATAVAAGMMPEKTTLGANLLATRLMAPEAPLDPEAIDDERLKEHVVPLYNNLVSKFGTHDNGLFLEDNRDLSFRYAMAWPHSRVLDAMADARSLPGQTGEDARKRYAATRQALHHYWQDEPFDMGSGLLPGVREFTPAGQFKYVDDNAWVGLRQAMHHLETGDPDALTMAIRTFKMGIREWDHERGGGLRWYQSKESGRCVVSNAPVAALGALLHRITGQPRYLYWGAKEGCADTIDWLNSNLRNPLNGLYWDNKYIDDGIEKTMWTYNQSSVAKAMAYLSRIDPKRYPIANALEVAIAAFRYFDQQDAEIQAKLSKGEPRQPHFYDPEANDGYKKVEFSSIFFADMLEIADMLPESTAFKDMVVRSLHERVRRLTHEYKTTLQQAGALRLAVLAYQNPLPQAS